MSRFALIFRPSTTLKSKPSSGVWPPRGPSLDPWPLTLGEAFFWSGFGGVEMLRDLAQQRAFEESAWSALQDVSLGCGLVFASELLLGLLSRELGAKAQAVEATQDCLKLAADVTATVQVPLLGRGSRKMVGKRVKRGV